MIADNALDAGVIIGEPVNKWKALNLAALVATTAINGTIAGRGTGADVMAIRSTSSSGSRMTYRVVAWASKRANSYSPAAWSISFGCKRAIRWSPRDWDWVRWIASFVNAF